MREASATWSLEKLRALDAREWERLQEAFSSRIFHFVKRHVRDHQACEDITQETFLGALKGIGAFDPRYTMEQFLFGIARNRMVDHLRKARPALLSPVEEDPEDGGPAAPSLERLASSRRPPDESALVHEKVRRRREVLARILRELVGELWEAGEYGKLMVLEYLFAMGRRNKEAAARFEKDEKAVAGIKFRALERLRALARGHDPGHSLFEGLWKPGAR